MKRLIATVLATLLFVITSPAHADNAGVWAKIDIKVPVHKFNEDVNLRLRLIPEFAFTGEAGGLQQTVIRGGPNLRLNSWFSISVHGISNTTGIRHDVRPELQPEFTIKLGDFQFKDRNRLSYRALDNAKGDRWQYANQLKVFYNIPKTPLAPFVSYEGALDFQLGKLTQHRMEAGLGIWTNNEWLVETGYLYRTALEHPIWAKDHFFYIAISNK